MFHPARHLAELARFDRPAGVWLLFWPCVWGLGLGRVLSGQADERFWFYAALCFIGAVAMRSAGCIYNDWCDRRLDAAVMRTKHRPLAAGTLPVWLAVVWAAVLLLIGLSVWWHLPGTAQWAALAALPLVALYPWMKRITYWPQAFLGLTFNWGIWVGALAIYPQFSPAMLLLYLTAILWTIGYDTVYAIQDMEYDVTVGVKSTAVRFGTAAGGLVWLCYLWQSGLLLWLGWILQLGVPYYAAILAALLLQFWSWRRLDFADPDSAKRGFAVNVWVGGIIAMGLLWPFGIG
jgi:4-hydroxybenzoate polyprenyltransferase